MTLGRNAPDYALLIGIDGYRSNTDSAARYPPLRGAVRDVERMARFLTMGLGMKRQRIHLLTSQASGGAEIVSYERLVAGFGWLSEKARSGDSVLIHYSGHGARARTIRQDLKGEGGVDEVLVPADGGDSNVRYLRDFEIGFWISRLIDRGIFPTLVLDACHAGGTVRAGSTEHLAVRGLLSVDESPRPRGSLVAPSTQLAAAWKKLELGSSSYFGSGWLPRPEGYVLLAACAATELAYESEVAGRGTHGLFSHWLLRGLERFGTSFSYRQIYERIYGRVRGEATDQTPQLEGEADRIFFGQGVASTAGGVYVLHADTAAVLLEAGRAQGLHEGARFVLSRPASRIDIAPAPLAEVEVSDVGSTQAWADYCAPPRQPIKAGDLAILIGSGVRRRRCTVSVEPSDDESVRHVGTVSRFLAEALRSSESWLYHEHEAPDRETDFKIVIGADAQSELKSRESHGLAAVGAPFWLHERRECERLILSLVHLAKYRNVEMVENQDPLSPLAGKLDLAIDPMPGSGPSGKQDSSHQQAFVRGAPQPSGILAIAAQNRSRIHLRLTVLCLQPDWSIMQVHPPAASGLYSVPLEEQQRESFLVRLGAPALTAKATVLIKAFVTVEATNFRWLELPPLAQRDRHQQQFRGQPRNNLENALASLVSEDVNEVRAADDLSQWDWAVQQQSIQMQASRNGTFFTKLDLDRNQTP